MVDNDTGETFCLRSTGRWEIVCPVDERLQQAILPGLSTRDYGKVASRIANGFGLSQSSVSRAFIERSARARES